MTDNIRHIIEQRLREMGAYDIVLKEEGDVIVVARFNCNELTSFNRNIEGWIQLGIELNHEGPQRYRILFLRQLSASADASLNSNVAGQSMS